MDSAASLIHEFILSKISLVLVIDLKIAISTQVALPPVYQLLHDHVLVTGVDNENSVNRFTHQKQSLDKICDFPCYLFSAAVQTLRRLRSSW